MSGSPLSRYGLIVAHMDVSREIWTLSPLKSGESMQGNIVFQMKCNSEAPHYTYSIYC
jgi:hypothetical protein